MNMSGRELFDFLKNNAATMNAFDFQEIMALAGKKVMKLCVLWATIGLGVGFALGAWLI